MTSTDPRRKTITVRVTPAEKAAIARHAEIYGKSVSDYAHGLIHATPMRGRPATAAVARLLAAAATIRQAVAAGTCSGSLAGLVDEQCRVAIALLHETYEEGEA